MNETLRLLKLVFIVGLVSTVSISSNNNLINAAEIEDFPTSNNLIAELSPGEQANADFRDKLSGRTLLKALKKGGHVIYFRKELI